MKQVAIGDTGFHPGIRVSLPYGQQFFKNSSDNKFGEK